MRAPDDLHALSLKQFRYSARLGFIKEATLVGTPHGFCIVARKATIGHAILTRQEDRAIRYFKNAAVALRHLKNIGYKSVKVDLKYWS